jgi:1,4-dihydroxy-2-naphthoyl-CoA synthase
VLTLFFCSGGDNKIRYMLLSNNKYHDNQSFDEIFKIMHL